MKVLITGASDGIGLEFCKQYLNHGYEVIATCRTKEGCDKIDAELRNDDLSVYKLDVTKQRHINKVRARLADDTLDIYVSYQLNNVYYTVRYKYIEFLDGSILKKQINRIWNLNKR